MTHTYTYATVDKETREIKASLGEINVVRRKPTVADSFYLDHGHYKVQTANGPIDVEAPVYIIFDTEGFPYPVTPEIFKDTWE